MIRKTPRNTLPKISAAFALGAMVLAISACNTVQGLGEDISSVGRKGEEVIK